MGFESPPVRVRARFDGKVLVLIDPVDLPVGTIIEGWSEPVRKPRNPQFGTARGQGHIAEGFDEIPDGFEEYL